MPSSTKLTRALVDVAMGRVPADLVIQNGNWVSVQSGEIIPGTDVAVKDGHIAYVGEDASHTIGKKTKVIDAKGRYLVPGLLDGHMHVESGMVTVTEFVRAVARARHDRHVHRPARDRECVRAQGRQTDAGGSAEAAHPRLGADAVLCSLGSGARNARCAHRSEGSCPGDEVGGHYRSG